MGTTLNRFYPGSSIATVQSVPEYCVVNYTVLLDCSVPSALSWTPNSPVSTYATKLRLPSEH
jgi:hypothetical protein